MLIKYTCDSKSQTLRMRYPFQSTSRLISHRNGWLFRVYMILLRVFVPEWNSRPGTRTGVNSRQGDSHRHDILWFYHINKYRGMRGNRSELTPGRKSPRCHVNSPLDPPGHPSHPSLPNHYNHSIHPCHLRYLSHLIHTSYSSHWRHPGYLVSHLSYCSQSFSLFYECSHAPCVQVVTPLLWSHLRLWLSLRH